jgi:hypothetical protein
VGSIAGLRLRNGSTLSVAAEVRRGESSPPTSGIQARSGRYTKVATTSPSVGLPVTGTVPTLQNVSSGAPYPNQIAKEPVPREAGIVVVVRVGPAQPPCMASCRVVGRSPLLSNKTVWSSWCAPAHAWTASSPRAATSAAAAAADSMAIWVLAICTTATAPHPITRMIGRTRASSTKAWPVC